MPPARIVGNVLLSAATRVTSGYRHVFDSQCGYTAIHRDALRADRSRRGVDALRLSERSARRGCTSAGVRVVDVAGAADLRRALEERHQLRHRAAPDPVGAAALVGLAPRARESLRRSMKIGVITTSYPRWPGDAAGNFVAAHVRRCARSDTTSRSIAAGEPIRTGERSGPGRLPTASDRKRTPVRIPSGLFFRGGAPDRLERGHGVLDATRVHRAADAPRSSAARGIGISRSRTGSRPRRWPRSPTRVPLLAIAHGGDVHTLARLHLLNAGHRAAARARCPALVRQRRAARAREGTGRARPADGHRRRSLRAPAAHVRTVRS